MLKNVYTVGYISRFIRQMFVQEPFLKEISIKGEVSNCTYQRGSGHLYFTLKDKEGVLNGAMFKRSQTGMKFRLEEGQQVIVTGRIDSYEAHSQYQIIAKSIELDGEGNLYQRLEELKLELQEMGMFDQTYKRPIPKYVRKVGVVTSATGAVIQDIRNVGFRRNDRVQIILSPALVQGDGAKESIVDAIQRLEQIDVDVIIVGRGGGSIEDLWAFNERIVAEAIFHCSVPVISAVGHEINFTIADLAADARAATPSQAAEMAIFEWEQAKIELAQRKQRLNLLMERKLDNMKERLLHMSAKLNFLSPQRRLDMNRKQLMDYEDKLLHRMERMLQNSRHRLAILASNLEGYSPTKKISSGYAYLEGKDGKSIKSIRQVEVSDEVTLYVVDGKIKAVVTEANENE